MSPMDRMELSPVQLAELRRAHVEAADDQGPICARSRTVWPCEHARLLVQIERLETELARCQHVKDQLRTSNQWNFEQKERGRELLAKAEAELARERRLQAWAEEALVNMEADLARGIEEYPLPPLIDGFRHTLGRPLLADAAPEVAPASDRRFTPDYRAGYHDALDHGESLDHCTYQVCIWLSQGRDPDVEWERV